MIYLNENSFTPTQKKIDIENSLQQSFATLPKQGRRPNHG